MKVNIRDIEEHNITCCADYSIDQDNVVQYDKMSEFGDIELWSEFVNEAHPLKIDDTMGKGDMVIMVKRFCMCGMMYTETVKTCKCGQKTVRG